MQAQRTPNQPVLVAVLHELLNVERFDTIADICEALKLRAARLRIPYNADSIAEALVIVHRSRPLTSRGPR